MQSEIKIDREGKWYYRNTEMSRQDIIRLLYRHLITADSGSFFLEMAGERCPVEVEDTAYVVRAVCQETDDRICLLLSDQTIEELDASTLRIGKGHIPYCRVKDGRFGARFSSSGYYRLAEHIEYDEGRGEYFIRLKGRKHYVPEQTGK